MLFATSLLLQAVASLAVGESLRGVPDELLYLYQPLPSDSSKWACLGDPSVILNLSQINDDYCDCPDGSDEPGTSACGSKSRFFCQNKGFAPRYISGSKVNDGVCDCCDCSDEEPDRSALWVDYQSCEQLYKEFERLVAEELDDQKKGSIALQQLKRKHNVASSSEHGFEDQQQLLELESSVARLTDSLKVQEEVLDNARALYRHQLKSENPVLFRFEQLDIPYLTSTIASVFNRVELISKSYYSLVQIMDDLAYDYNKKLNDKVVNDNVGKYIDFMNNHSEDINVSPSLDSDQRVQIEEYLSLELPEMFRKGTSKVPLLAIKGKFAMVDAIMKVKMKYKDDLVAFMKVLVELMDDISTNYNVNFQDSGVRKAVAAYGDFLGEYANIFDPLEFPKKFHEEFERLGQFIAEEAPAIAAPSAEANDSILSQIKEFFNYHWQVIRQDPSSIGAQQSRIDTMESKCLSSREALRVERQELQRLTNQIKNTDSTADSMDLEEIGELLQNMNPGCINVAYDNYLYQICFNSEEGRIVQKEDKPDGNTVLIGRFDSFQFDHEVSSQRYIDGIRNQYSDSDLMSHLESEEGPNDAKLLMGNLPDINSGLVIHYNGGARCWNGPARSAQVSFKCSEAFQIRNVYEPTRCHYVFEISGPLGCPSRFNFERPEWL